jgi:hypothetical protein
MIACSTPPPDSSPADRFMAWLPAVRRQAGYALRRLRGECRAEAEQEVVAHVFQAFVRLLETGRGERAFVSPLVRYAVRQYRAGRITGNRLNTWDVLSRYRRRGRGCTVERLDRPLTGSGEWGEIIVEDRRSGPAETAVARLDFRAWLQALPPRRRRAARLLARGETTQETARRLRVSAARISQMRRELESDWRRFQNEPADRPADVASGPEQVRSCS